MPSMHANHDAPASSRAQAIAFAGDHLQELVGDLIHWRRKGALPAGSLMTRLSGILEPECASGDSMQQAEYIVSSLALQQVAEGPVDSVKRRLEWTALALRDIADRGRTQLGDAYPEVLQVLGTVRTCLEDLGDDGQAKATPPQAQAAAAPPASATGISRTASGSLTVRRWAIGLFALAAVGVCAASLSEYLAQRDREERAAAYQQDLEDYYREHPEVVAEQERLRKECAKSEARGDLFSTACNAPVRPSAWALSEQRLKREDAGADR